MTVKYDDGNSHFYLDDGCYIHTSCLECPLKHCVLDVSINAQAAQGLIPESVLARLEDGSGRGVRAAKRKMGGFKLISDGASDKEVARVLNVAPSVVSRWRTELMAKEDVASND